MNAIAKQLADLSEPELFNLVEAIDAEEWSGGRRTARTCRIPLAAVRWSGSRVTGGAWGRRRRRSRRQVWENRLLLAARPEPAGVTASYHSR